MPAAGEQHREDARPVVAAGALVDAGRPAEVGQQRHQRRLQQAALVQVVQQGGQAAVQRRQPLLQAGEDLGVVVPAVVVHGDEGHARLDQPPGQQAALAQARPAVGVADPVRLAAEVEGLPAGRCQQPEARSYCPPRPRAAAGPRGGGAARRAPGPATAPVAEPLGGHLRPAAAGRGRRRPGGWGRPGGRTGRRPGPSSRRCSS